MTDRERLIELVWNSIANRLGTVFRENVEDIADDLLANGVIVPPCKVGDTVYKIMDIESVHRKILEVEVLSISIEKTMIFFCKTVKNYLYRYGKYTIDDFGKTVFLTKEEAEAELEKRCNNAKND